MTATAPSSSSGQPTASASTLVLKFASGPIVALLLYLLPYGGVPPEGHVALGVFGWMIVWWMVRMQSSRRGGLGHRGRKRRQETGIVRGSSTANDCNRA